MSLPGLSMAAAVSSPLRVHKDVITHWEYVCLVVFRDPVGLLRTVSGRSDLKDCGGRV